MKQSRTIDLDNLSTQEIEKVLADRKAADQYARDAKRKGYERVKDATINELGAEAELLFNQLCRFKGKAMHTMTGFRFQLMEYGDLRRGKENRGSFEIKNDLYKITFKTQIQKRFDERAVLAEAKLREFLSSFVRKKDQNAYKLIMSLLQRDEKTGDFDIDLINRLYKMEHEFDNPLWKEALAMFRESYMPTGSAQYIAFAKKRPDGSYESLVLDFAKLKSNQKEAEPAA